MATNEDKVFRPYIIVNEFTEMGVRDFKEQFDMLTRSDYPIIPVYIDSFGGEIYSLLAMIDMIEHSDKPVATICLGKAMSAGGVLLACGTPGWRFIGRNSTVMIHDAGSFSHGKIEEMKTDIRHVDDLNDVLYRILAEKCGHANKEYFKKVIKDHGNVNWYLNATEAKKHKIVDHISMPRFDFSFNILMKEDDKSPLIKNKKSAKVSTKEQPKKVTKKGK